jgi:lactoylglutathione lyase
MRPGTVGEPAIIGWMPAAAVYFRDPGGHQLEYLPEPRRPDASIVTGRTGLE